VLRSLKADAEAYIDEAIISVPTYFNSGLQLVGEAPHRSGLLTKMLPKVAAEMALSVLAYNLTRVMNIVGIKPLMAAIAA
jgi:hypothetical protein